MTERGSYRPSQEGRGLEQELARLEAQVAVSWAEERRQLDRLGVDDGLRLLEIGCGPGLVTQQLLAAWPGLRITAVDHDRDLLARAATASGRRSTSATFLAGSAESLPCAGNQFDIALARYVFQHLPDPVAAAREVHRVLRPGGRAILIDVDAALWGLAEPQFPEVVPIFMKTGRAQAARGGDRLIGRKLHRILRDGGFGDARLDAFAYHSDALGLDAFDAQLSADRLLPLAATGVITGAELDIVRHAHARFKQSPGAMVLMIGFVGSGTK